MKTEEFGFWITSISSFTLGVVVGFAIHAFIGW